MNAAELIKALGGSHGKARCPAHDDHTPSLSIRDGDDGRLLTHCHAGCEPAAVWDALKRLGLVGDRCSTSKAAPSRREPDRTAEALAIWNASIPPVGTPVEGFGPVSLSL